MDNILPPENKSLVSISDLCKKSLNFYKQRFLLMVTLALIPFANFVILSLLSELMSSNIHGNEFVIGVGFIAALFSLFALVVNFWIQITFFYAIKEKDLAVNAKNLLMFSWDKIYSSSWVTFLVAIMLIGGFILFIVPGVIFSIWFSLALYVFVFEDIKGMPALYASKELVKGYWWPLFARFFVFGLITAIIGIVPVIGGVLNIFFIMPLSIIYGYFIYQNLKEIKKTV